MESTLWEALEELLSVVGCRVVQAAGVDELEPVQSVVAADVADQSQHGEQGAGLYVDAVVAVLAVGVVVQGGDVVQAAEAVAAVLCSVG